MQEKHVRIDMDYSSSPVWFSDDGKSFVNGDIDELGLKNESLNESLNYYQEIWYKFESKKGNPQINDPTLGKFESLDVYVEALAKAISTELPEKSIYVWDEESLKNKLI